MRIFAGRGGVKQHWVVETAIFFSAFSVYTFGSFRNKANIIVPHYLDPQWLSTDPKTDTLNDLEWPFYIRDNDHFIHFVDE